MALNTLSQVVLNYKQAKSRIDVAQESSTLLSTQIRQQVGAAVLAQANQLPGLVLDLLKNISGR